MLTLMSGRPWSGLSLTAMGVAGVLALGSPEPARPALEPVHSSSDRLVKASGHVTGLLPGTTRRVDLKLTNLTSEPVLVDAVFVTITGIDKKHRACPLGDYVPVQYSGPTPLRLTKGQVVKLSHLGIAESLHPGVTMLDQPRPQNACLGAKLTLLYSGVARYESGGTP